MQTDETTSTDTTATGTTSTEGGGATTQQTQQTGAAAGGEAKSYTQADIDRIVGDRLARDRAARGRTETAPTKGTERKATEAERLDRIEQDGAFYRGLSRTGTKLSEDQEADLLDLFRIHKPERPGEWLQDRITRFGLGKQDAATTTTTTTTTAADAAAKTAAGAAGASTVPNKVNPLDTGALIDVSKLTAEQVMQLGPQGIREHLERVVSAGQARDGRPPVPAVLRPKGR